MSGSKYYRDLAERVAATFLGTFVSALASAGPVGLTDLSVWQSAALGGFGAVAALLKGVVARSVGNSSSASLSRKV